MDVMRQRQDKTRSDRHESFNGPNCETCKELVSNMAEDIRFHISQFTFQSTLKQTVHLLI
jgi:hypothetical protein